VKNEGKGVRIMHVFNDNLWIYGFSHQQENNRVIPEGFSSKMILPVEQVVEVSDEEEEEEESQSTAKEGEQPAEAPQEEEQPLEPSDVEKQEGAIIAEDMDALLEKAFMDTIKNHITDEELPLDVGALFSRMLMNSGDGNLGMLIETFLTLFRYQKVNIQKSWKICQRNGKKETDQGKRCS
jgi:hypothetical protein